jgi:hypothetical protein
MPTADGAHLVSPGPIMGACAICGAELIADYWVLDYPRMAHINCIDWNCRPFPFSWRIGPLSFLERTLPPQASRVAARARHVHETANARWPAQAVKLIDGCTLEANRARARLAELGVDRRHLQRF